MMGIVVPETCWVYKKYNKVISGIWLVFILQLSEIQVAWSWISTPQALKK